MLNAKHHTDVVDHVTYTAATPHQLEATNVCVVLALGQCAESANCEMQGLLT